MKRKWSWWRAWLVQTAEMLILGGFASFAELLGAVVYGIIIWAIVPLLGALSAVVAFGLQWLLYLAVARGIASSDTLQILSVVPFTKIWYIVALVFLGAGILVGVGGSLTAIRRFLRV